MYDFVKINQIGSPSTSSVAFSINGAVLDDVLTTSTQTFRTLNVSGRGLAEYDHEIQDIPGRHGSAHLRSKIAQRQIVIECLVEADNNNAFRLLMRNLNQRLHSLDGLRLSFNDEPNLYYNAFFISGSNPKEDSNSLIMELTFDCYDPFKYRTSQNIAYISNGAVANLDTDYGVIADEIGVLSVNSNSFKIVNQTTGKQIVYSYNGGSSPGTYIIHQKRGGIYVGGLDNNLIRWGLDILESDFPNFTINDGDRITLSPSSATLAVTYRGVTL